MKISPEMERILAEKLHGDLSFRYEDRYENFQENHPKQNKLQNYDHYNNTSHNVQKYNIHAPDNKSNNVDGELDLLHNLAAYFSTVDSSGFVVSQLRTYLYLVVTSELGAFM